MIAVRESGDDQKEIVGFACYDATCMNFFGPTGVKESERGKGVGKALLLAALHAMKEQGYAYAIIGARVLSTITRESSVRRSSRDLSPASTGGCCDED